MEFVENENRWSKGVIWMSDKDPTDGQIVYLIPQRPDRFKPYLGCIQVVGEKARARILGDVQYDAQRQLNPPSIPIDWPLSASWREDVYAIPRDAISDLLIKTLLNACAEAEKVRFLREFFADFQKGKDQSV